MRKRVFAVLLLLLTTFTGKQAYAALPHLHLFDPYFYGQNESFVGLRWNNAVLDGAFLNGFMLDVDYGVNDNIYFGIEAPYLTIGGADDGGVFGDIDLKMKFNIAQSPELLWKIGGMINAKIGTGVIEEDSVRRVNGNEVYYFPFVSGTPSLSFTFFGAYFFEKLMVNLALTYDSENESDGSLFFFWADRDRFEVQLSADYPFRIENIGPRSLWLIVRPAFYVTWEQNVLVTDYYPDALYTTLEVNFRLKNILRWTVFANLPVYLSDKYMKFEWGIQVGKTF